LVNDPIRLLPTFLLHSLLGHPNAYNVARAHYEDKARRQYYKQRHWPSDCHPFAALGYPRLSCPNILYYILPSVRTNCPYQCDGLRTHTCILCSAHTYHNNNIVIQYLYNSYNMPLHELCIHPTYTT